MCMNAYKPHHRQQLQFHNLHLGICELFSETLVLLHYFYCNDLYILEQYLTRKAAQLLRAILSPTCHLLTRFMTFLPLDFTAAAAALWR